MPRAGVTTSQGLLWSVQKMVSGGLNPTLALDASGLPHISYYDYASSDLKYAYYDGSTWHITTVDSGVNTGDYYEEVGWDLSLALDLAGHRHIAYTYERWKRSDSIATLDQAELRYAYFDGTDWITETIVGGRFDFGDTSLALDASDRPHIAYEGPYLAWWGEDCCALNYARFDGSSWLTETVHAGSGYIGAFNSLGLDTADLPHISYYRMDTDDLMYASYDGSNWHLKIVDSAGVTGRATSLDLDTLDQPHISYYDWTNSLVKYAHYTGTSWSIQSVDSTSQDATSLVLDGLNRPHIVYDYDDGTYVGPRHAYFDGSAWQFERIYRSGSVSAISLVLESSNPLRLHVAWSDGTWIFYARGAPPTAWVYLPLVERGY